MRIKAILAKMTTFFAYLTKLTSTSIDDKENLCPMSTIKKAVVVSLVQNKCVANTTHPKSKLKSALPTR